MIDGQIARIGWAKVRLLLLTWAWTKEEDGGSAQNLSSVRSAQRAVRLDGRSVRGYLSMTYAKRAVSAEVTTICAWTLLLSPLKRSRRSNVANSTRKLCGGRRTAAAIMAVMIPADIRSRLAADEKAW